MFLKENLKSNSIKLTSIEELELEYSNSIEDLKTVVFCNITTTSLNKDSGDILRLNLKYAKVDNCGNFSKVSKTISMFNDPERKLTPEESKFLDFDLEEVKNQKINWVSIENIFSQADFVVSHNSSFVRPFIQKYISEETEWGCTLEFIDWKSLGFPSRNLETLCVFSGFYYDFYDSTKSLEALITLLSRNNLTNILLDRCKKPDLQIFAANSPRDLNYLLKERGYRWNPDVFCWWKSIDSKEIGEEESRWLKNSLEGCEPQVFEVDKKFRFVNT